MTDTRTAPLHYTLPYVDRMEPRRTPTQGDFVEYTDQHLVFDKTPREERTRVPAFIAGAGATHPIVRAEFFNGGDLNRRGVILFDNRGTPVLHVQHALLGYPGDAPLLSKVILEALGVVEDFDRITEAVDYNKPYVVIFSRETITTEDGVEVAAPNQPPLRSWKWWQA